MLIFPRLFQAVPIDQKVLSSKSFSQNNHHGDKSGFNLLENLSIHNQTLNWLAVSFMHTTSIVIWYGNQDMHQILPKKRNNDS